MSRRTTFSPKQDRPYDITDLLRIMADLRDPEHGCPWDQKQTFASIAPYTLEEAYEVADAIERNDLADLRDELGDLLLQVVYHARIGEEAGAFSFADVVHAIAVKMVRRHPHVFGTKEERAAGALPGFWERIKAEERAERMAARITIGGAETTTEQPAGLLDSVPANLPALTQAVKLQKKAARVGFDWPDLGPVLAKMREELDELSEAIETGNTEQVEDEFGDLLFVMANVARHLKIDPETSLRGTNQKFRRRFAAIEAELAMAGKTTQDATLEEMDALWDAAKLTEKASSQG